MLFSWTSQLSSAFVWSTAATHMFNIIPSASKKPSMIFKVPISRTLVRPGRWGQNLRLYRGKRLLLQQTYRMIWRKSSCSSLGHVIIHQVLVKSQGKGPLQFEVRLGNLEHFSFCCITLVWNCKAKDMGRTWNGTMVNWPLNRFLISSKQFIMVDVSC